MIDFTRNFVRGVLFGNSDGKHENLKIQNKFTPPNTEDKLSLVFQIRHLKYFPGYTTDIFKDQLVKLDNFEGNYELSGSSR